MRYVSERALRERIPNLSSDATLTDFLALLYLSPAPRVRRFDLRAPTASGGEAAAAFDVLGSVFPADGVPRDEGWRLHASYGAPEGGLEYLYFPFGRGGAPGTRQVRFRAPRYNRYGLQRRLTVGSSEIPSDLFTYEQDPEDRSIWHLDLREDWERVIFERLLGGKALDFWSFAAWVLRFCPIPSDDDDTAIAWAARTTADQFRLADELVAKTPDAAAELGAWFYQGDAPDPADFLAEKPVESIDLIELLAELETTAGHRLPEGIGKVRLAARGEPENLETVLLRAGNGRSLNLERDVTHTITNAIRMGKHLILMGPPGTGKSTLARNIAEAAEAGLWEDIQVPAGILFTTATASWTTFDTLGGYVPNERGELEFRAGLFLDAFGGNRWVVVDELNRADVDKAFGQLMTILAEAETTVELPYVVEIAGERRRVQILPSRKWGESRPEKRLYAVPPGWRLVCTMNTFDRNSLFSLSYAFLRRFAVIYVDALPPDIAVQLAAGAVDGLTPADQMRLGKFLTIAAKLGRPLGPAIAIDIARYVSRVGSSPIATPESSRSNEQDAPVRDPFLEAIVAFAVPQLEGLEPSDLADFRDRLVTEQVIAANAEAQLRRRFSQLLDLPE